MKKGVATHALIIFLGHTPVFNAPIKVTAKSFQHWDIFEEEGRAAAQNAKAKHRSDCLGVSFFVSLYCMTEYFTILIC
jgi:hypothetical protein